MGRRSRSRSDSPKRRKRERSRSRERHSRDKRRRESRKDRSRERDRNSTSRRWKEDSSSLSARRDSMRREERLKEEEAYRKRQEEKRKQLGGDMEEEEEKRGGQESKITDEELLKLQEKRKERLSRLEALTKGGQEQNEAAAPSNSGLSSLDLMKQFEAKLNRKSGNSLKTQGSSSSADFSKMDEPEVEKAPEKTKKRGMGLGGGLVLDSDSENENEALERHEDKTKFTRKELEADDDDRKGPGARGSKRPREEKSEKKEKEKEKEEDEVDPLDAFMSTINTEIKEIEQVDKVKAAKEKKRQQRMGERLFEEDNVPDEIRKSKDDDEKYVFDMLYKKKDLAVVDHSSMDYHDFKKAFYIETPEITRMTENEVKQLRNLLGKIKIKGKNCPRPIKLWTHAGLSLKVLQTINKLGYSLPTPIQAQALPAVMSGRDVIGIAKTGSGKTLAFLLPLLRHIMDQPPLGEGEGPMAIIMAPTRELATQIYNEAKKFTKVVGMRMCCAYGGAPISEQIADLKRGAEIVVCTPGRMIDLLCANQGRVTNLHRVTYLVLDEADRMFDMGFEPQIMRIINNIRPDRQTVMFSATFPRAVETLARKILKQPLEIIVGERSTVCDDITQVVDVVDEDRKWHKLLEVLGQWQHIESILVFVDRQESADTLCKQLLEAGYDKVNAIHGGKSQEQRDQILADYKNKKLAILIATSVAARGLHVKNLQLVINYNAPNHYEDYVHRVGRTGRAGNKGTAYTFLTEDEAALAADLVVALEYNKQEVRPAVKKLADDFKEKQKAGQARHHSGFGGKGFKFDEEEQAQQKKARDTLKKASGLEVEEEEEELKVSSSENESITHPEKKKQYFIVNIKKKKRAKQQQKQSKTRADELKLKRK
eukprot:GCRY01004468.1.p1 GENE.GCRY01004468.1~~GCRY01004468.1.p1  ORF type:complete len:880 (+),score=325.74 GCRY01004468.1:283-2922(+)